MEYDDEEPMESTSPPHSPSATSGHSCAHTQPPPAAAQLHVSSHSCDGPSLPLTGGTPPQTHRHQETGAAVGLYMSPCSPQISLSEYNTQAGDYTQAALRELKASPEYKRHTQKCYSCGASWFDGEWSQGCSECGDGAMQMPCLVCRGKCGRTWRRDVELSHSTQQAHWDGACGHKEAAAMLKDMLQLSSVLDAMEDLRT